MVDPPEESSKYIDDGFAFQTRLSYVELERPEQIEEYGVTPQEATDFLERLGLKLDQWDAVFETSSHEIKAMIIIARGQHRRLEWVIRQNLRRQEGDLDTAWSSYLLPPVEE